jgi:hypothetical protein
MCEDFSHSASEGCAEFSELCVEIGAGVHTHMM